MRARFRVLALLLLAFLPSTSIAQQWYSVQTGHLISYSDGNDRGAREAALRGEQLIAVFDEIFHRKDISFATPLALMATQSAGSQNHGVLVRTPVANYVIADLAQPEAWTQAARAIATLTLDDNYPRAQPWFDNGIASYLAGVRFNGDQMELGAVPPGMAMPGATEWIQLGKLFEIRELTQLPARERQVFEAESWAVVRWLIDNSRLAQAGAYLNAVQSRGVAPERALQEAFSMSSADMDRLVRDSSANLSTKKMPAPRVEKNLYTSKKVAAADAHVQTANLSLFGPEGDQTLKELVAFMRENQQNAAVHRSLAWAFMLRNDQENAVEHIRRALELDSSDPTMHYLYARWVNQGEENTIRVDSADVSLGAELREALQHDPNYAAAFELLGLAQLSGDQVKPALANLQRASTLRPRSSRYYLNLGRAYEAAGNLDAARNLFLYAGAGGDAALAAEASQLARDIGRQKKQQQQWQAMGMNPDPNAKHGKYDNLAEAIAEDEKAEAKARSAESAPDSRKTENLKGRVVSVECGTGAGAILTVSSGGQTWRMQAADRNTVVLIGADHFDCEWRNMDVLINYKRSGRLQGDLISLEAD